MKYNFWGGSDEFSKATIFFPGVTISGHVINVNIIHIHSNHASLDKKATHAHPFPGQNKKGLDRKKTHRKYASLDTKVMHVQDTLSQDKNKERLNREKHLNNFPG